MPSTLEPPAAETLPALDGLIMVYREIHGANLDFKQGKFTVRHWDGMDGCWSDLEEATNVDAEKALAVWFMKTDGAKRAIRFSEIDYFRIFPGGTKMVWDGSEGREMFRDGDEP
jgi:hypothetical protein